MMMMLILAICFSDLYLNGNDLQSQGVVDLVHILAQQAVKDNAERQEEERLRAVEATQAARLRTHSSPYLLI